MTVDAGRLHAHYTAPTDDTPERDVTAGPVTPTAEQGAAVVTQLRRRLRELDEQLQDERTKHERALRAAHVRAERLRAWLVVIDLRTEGKARGFAQQAIHSTEWPLGVRLPSEKTITRPEEDPDHDHG